MTELLTEAQDQMDDVVGLRRRLHRFPEVGNHLPRTREMVLEALNDLPLTLTLHESTSGIAAVLSGASEGPTVLLRGDMDGLPLTEDTGLDFASETGDTMHACGHDLHTAMLFGAAKLLSSKRDHLAGSVIFMFQPGEEGYAGAKFMLEEGLLDTAGTPASAGFAIHVSPAYTSGEVHIRPGAQMASADELYVTVHGSGGHASSPYKAVDPIAVASEIVLAIQVAVTRRINVFEPAVITFGRFAAGTAHNIIPPVAELSGTIRAVSEESRSLAEEIARRVATNIAAAHGARAEVRIDPGYPVSVNHADTVASIRDMAGRVLGSEMIHEMPAPIMGAEDWSYVMQQIPAAMAFLGACPPDLDPATAPVNHSNLVLLDEAAMASGVALYSGFVMDRLKA
ncbi:MAG: amidohydrolase [bacterium]|nr:amidohydrolase [bacterium]